MARLVVRRTWRYGGSFAASGYGGVRNRTNRFAFWAVPASRNCPEECWIRRSLSRPTRFVAGISLNRPRRGSYLLDSAFLPSELAVITSKRRLVTCPTATPIEEQPMKATVGLRAKLVLIGDVTTTPRKPPARHANKRVCTLFLLIKPSVLAVR